MTRLAIIAAALALSACGKTTAPNVTVVSAGVRLPTVADSEFDCGNQPAVPARQPGKAKRTDSQVEGFILDLRNWGAGCKDKLEVAGKTWRATEAAQAEADAKIKHLKPR